jgi:hypothetical protein
VQTRAPARILSGACYPELHPIKLIPDEAGRELLATRPAMWGGEPSGQQISDKPYFEIICRFSKKSICRSILLEINQMHPQLAEIPRPISAVAPEFRLRNLAFSTRQFHGSSHFLEPHPCRLGNEIGMDAPSLGPSNRLLLL